MNSFSLLASIFDALCTVSLPTCNTQFRDLQTAAYGIEDTSELRFCFLEDTIQAGQCRFLFFELFAPAGVQMPHFCKTLVGC